MKEVVRIAIMVPTGIDLWASLRSPDLLEPAIIPETTTCFWIKYKGYTLKVATARHDRRAVASHLPVTEGKYIPTSIVKQVAMSLKTYGILVSTEELWAASEGRLSFSINLPALP